MKQQVFFVPLENGESDDAVAAKVVRLANKAGLEDLVGASSLVGILQHVGEDRGVGYIKPPVTRAMAAAIRDLGGTPFLTGSTTLYRGRRSNACDHLMQAYEHGFTPDAIGCPMVMCDGLRGSERVSVEVPGAIHCPTAYLGSAVAFTDAVIAITHPTGHPIASFGGAIKNVSMGLSSRGGKMAMHHGGRPRFLPERCTACGRCVEWCPQDAIELQPKATLIEARCIGCGECLAVCPADAVEFDWGQSGNAFLERMVEYAVAARLQLKERLLYVNVIRHFQQGCDCFGTPQKAICDDIGIVASRDLVAVDTATADLLLEHTGKDLARQASATDYRHMLEYGERLGLGTRAYARVDVEQ